MTADGFSLATINDFVGKDLGVSDWLTNRDWIASRLQQEILTLKFGVARGDEIELQRDPVVQTALRKLRGAP